MSKASRGDMAPRPGPPELKRSSLPLLAAVCASVFLSGCLTSMLAPVLPRRLDELQAPRGGWMRGAIFGAYPLTVAAVSLVVPEMTDRFGRKSLLVLGLAFEGSLVIAFGAARVHGRHGDAGTLWLYLVLRILTGVCEALQNTVFLLYATDEFEPQGVLGQVMGWSESCAGIGFIVGPSLGAALYQVGGFKVPFLVLGLAFLALLPALPFALRNVPPPRRPDEAGPRPPWRAYMTYDVLNAAGGTVLMGASFGAIMPTLSEHLAARLALHEEWKTGAVYTIPALVYGVSCPLAGVLADRGSNRQLMRSGYSLLAIAFFMMGPIPILHPLLPFLWAPGSAAAWIWAVGAMVLFGIGGACGFVPTMPAMQRGAAHLGPLAAETVASVYWTVYFTGEGLGPELGTTLVGALGPGWGYAAVGFVLVAFVAASSHYEQFAPPESALGRPPGGGGGDAESGGRQMLALGAGAGALPAPADGCDDGGGDDGAETAGLLPRGGAGDGRGRRRTPRTAPDGGGGGGGCGPSDADSGGALLLSPLLIAPAPQQPPPPAAGAGAGALHAWAARSEAAALAAASERAAAAAARAAEANRAAAAAAQALSDAHAAAAMGTAARQRAAAAAAAAAAGAPRGAGAQQPPAAAALAKPPSPPRPPLVTQPPSPARPAPAAAAAAAAAEAAVAALLQPQSPARLAPPQPPSPPRHQPPALQPPPPSPAA